ncbi:MAG: SusF/SusE family outer membrane protein [Bacteroidales bacterium]|nr:SusF/SusE family outer membrane protein [Bacteroidales bacterium]
MKIRHIFHALACMMLALALTGCEGEKDLNIIEGELPIKTNSLYMVGDATPNGWDIGNPTPLSASTDDALIFTWEGPTAKKKSPTGCPASRS